MISHVFPGDTAVAAGISLATFLVGVAVGFTLREAVALARTGHTRVMPWIRSALTRSRAEREGGTPPRFLVLALLVALVVNAVLGVLLIVARAATEQEGRERTALAECVARYNAALGAALDDRDAAIRAAADSEIRLWTKYGELYELATKDPSKIPQAQVALSKEIAQHREDLIETQATRAANPYPDRDLCAREAVKETDR